MGRNLSIVQKGLLLVLLPWGLHVGLIDFLLWVRAAKADADQWADHSRVVLVRTHALRELLQDAQLGIRGYALTGDEAMAAPSCSAREKLPHLVAALPALVADDPGQQKLLKSIEGRVGWLLRHYDEARADVKEGRRDRAVANFRRGNSTWGIAAMRAELSDFLAAERRLDLARRERYAALDRWFFWLVVGGAVPELAVVLGLLWAYSRDVGRRLTALTADADRLGRGEPPAPPRGGGDELGRLEAAFHATAGALRARDADLRATRELLGGVVDHAPAVIYVKDRDGRHTLVNARFEQLARPREVQRCYELGCNVYVTKPVASDEFVEAVKQLGLFLAVVSVPGRDRGV